MQTVDIERITEEFIKDGFFSEYLPPAFTIRNQFDPSCVSLSDQSDLIEPMSFNMSRFTEDGKRRIIYIPEFSSYLKTVQYMKDNRIIEDLILLSNSTHSFSPLVQVNGSLTRHERDYHLGITLTDVDQEAFKSTYVPNVAKKIIRAKGAKGILSLDISNFYPSIYTHLIPSIKLGYENAETQYKAQRADNTDPIITDDYRVYKKLDEYIRNMNVGRTNGLLPGTLISQFLAEALLARIDKELASKDIAFVRYVDDYEIFIYDEKDLQQIQNIVVSCLGKYFLSLNTEKTKYTPFPYYVVENLENLYLNCIGSHPKTADLMKLFNTFFDLEKSGTKGAIRFLVKSISDSFISPDPDLLFSYLLNILVNDSRSLVKVCQLLISQKNEISIDDKATRQIECLLEQHIDANNQLETIWLLYLRKKVSNSKLPAKLSNKIAVSNNDLAKLILIEEFHSYLPEKTTQIIIDGASSWLLCYQLFFHDYISRDSFSSKSHIKKNLAFYSKLKRNHFSFYMK